MYVDQSRHWNVRAAQRRDTPSVGAATQTAANQRVPRASTIARWTWSPRTHCSVATAGAWAGVPLCQCEFLDVVIEGIAAGPFLFEQREALAKDQAILRRER